ncbi:cytochrome P450 [Hyaloraphidium curvatum]|nr:cytochrome P450 [Hyaloraphidium curvatum]
MDLLIVLLAALAAGALYVVFLMFKYRGRAAFTHEMPGVPQVENALPLIGHLVHFGNISPYIHEKFREWEKEYQVARLNFWMPALAHLDSVIVFSPKDLETVLRDPYTFVKGKDNAEMFREFFGFGIFGTDGELWKVQRKVASNIFNEADVGAVKSFRDFYVPVFETDSIKLRGHLEAVAKASRSDPKVYVDVQDLLLRSTMDSFVKLATGFYLGNLEGQGQIAPDGKYTLHDVPFSQAFDKYNVLTTKRASNPLWKITEHLDGSKKVAAWANKTLNEFSLRVVNDKRAKLEKAGGSKPDGQRSDLLDFFMETKHDDGSPITTRELQDMIVNMVLAGRDTTAQTLSWVVYEMDKHPEIADKMRAEMDAVLGPDKDAVPSYEQILKLKYCLAVFSETLRLHSNVPLNFKMVNSDKPIVLGGTGTTVYPGQRIFFHTWAMGYSEKIWGPDAGEFKPERWIDEKGSVRKEDTFKYPMFNAGPRICLGMDMAKQEAMVLSCTLFRKFRLKVVKEDDPEKWGDFANRRARYDQGATLGVRKSLDVQVVEI